MKLSKQNQAFTDICSFINDKLKKSGQRFRIGFVNIQGGSKYIYFFDRESKSKIGTQYYMSSNKQMMTYLKGIENLLSMIQVMEHPVNAITHGIVNEQKWIDGLDYSAAEMAVAFSKAISRGVYKDNPEIEDRYRLSTGIVMTVETFNKEEAEGLISHPAYKGYKIVPA